MRRIRFFIDLGSGQTHSEHFDFPGDTTSSLIDEAHRRWVEGLNQGWEELIEVPSPYKEEVKDESDN